MHKLGFDTMAIHGDVPKKDVHNAIKYPVYAGAAFSFESAEALEDSFSLRVPAHAYSRVTNPTVEAFERKITLLEQGRSAVAVSSGMAAVTSALLTLVKQGDNIVSSNALFGNTFSLLKNTFRNFGVETRFVDICDLDAIENAIDENTRAVFFETIANPKMSVPDITKIVDMSHKRKVAVIVDSTLTTPFLFRGKEIGVDLVVHSSTKLISGGGTGIGGVIVDLGNFDWSDYPSLEKHKKLGELAFVARLKKEIHKNMGVCMAPQIAYLHSLGLETLSLRVEKACENALSIATCLQDNKKVEDVSYPGLSSSVFHELAKKQFDNRFGSVLAFKLADKETCFRFLNHLKVIKRATNLGDNTSLIIHPASTIFIDCTAEEKEMMGAGEGVIRLSVGIENVEDLTGDIQQALDSL